jgi:transposase
MQVAMGQVQRTVDRLHGDANLEPMDGLVPRLCRTLVQRCHELTEEISRLDKEIAAAIEALVPSLLAITGCGTLTAAKIVGETAGVRRFKSRHAYARHNGTAPLPVWSGNRERHRLSRTGNRQLNTALHRIAITQAHYHQPARDFLQRRRAGGNTTTESIRALKRRLSDVIYQALLADS